VERVGEHWRDGVHRIPPEGFGEIRYPADEQATRRCAEQEGLTSVRFEQADAQVADLGVDRYDRVISRAGVMFFGDPVAAFANLARALKPDGRMVLLVWQSFAENEWLGAFLSAVAAGRDIPPPPPDGPGPFSLGDADRVRAVLTAAGFSGPELTAERAGDRSTPVAPPAPASRAASRVVCPMPQPTSSTCAAGRGEERLQPLRRDSARDRAGSRRLVSG
jgi:SAM-dependent methyltransferase